jgi:hypothetical protein
MGNGPIWTKYTEYRLKNEYCGQKLGLFIEQKHLISVGLVISFGAKDGGQRSILSDMLQIVPLEICSMTRPFSTSAGLICASRAFVALHCRTSLAR